MRVVVIGFVLAGIAACSGDDRSAAQVERRDTAPAVRRIEPPNNLVRLLPPYVITSTEVGPYKLKQKIATLLDKLPSGPRMERFEIPGVLHTSLMRAEDGTVLIGGEPQATTNFVVVINNSDIARTESGVHVGARRAALDKLGAVLDDPDHAFDPRVLVPQTMRNARFVLDDDRVSAIVILGDAPAAREPSPDTAPCPRPKSTETMFGACMAGGGRLVEVGREEVLVHSPDSDKPIPTKITNLMFAVALRNPIDGRDEIVAITRSDDSQQRTWSIVAFRFDGVRRVTVVDPLPLYSITSAQTRWIGADLRDIDLHLELSSRADGIEVGGLLTTRGANEKIRDVIAISPVTVARRHQRSPPGEVGDAGVSDERKSP